MDIKQSVINTFNRVGIPYEELLKNTEQVEVSNWITGETFITTPLVKACVRWVYQTTGDMERGFGKTRIDDFDRVRYFILAQDKNVYMGCID
jgi:hypothetical protein